MGSSFFSGFSLFRRAFRITRREIGVSLKLLAIVTLCFAVALYCAEGLTNEKYSFWDALVWTFVKYVEDPADIVSPPVTVVGKIIGTLVGILGIAIFAVPAGLIGSGVLEAISEEKKEENTNKNCRLLHKRFRRIAQSPSWIYNKDNLKVTLKGVPRFRTFAHIQVKTGMRNDDIIDAVNSSPDMRLMNMSTTLPAEDKQQDQLVVVHFPLNNEYGCCIDRGSDVTVVAPVAVTQLGTGSFAFSMAAMGGFNYVSKELTPNPDDPFGFYSMQKSNLKLIGDYDTKEDVESQALHFMDDLKRLKAHSEARGKKHWFFFIMGSTKSADCQVHLWRLATDKDCKLPRIKLNEREFGSTVMQCSEENLQNIFASIKDSIEQYDIVVKDKKQKAVVCIDNDNILKGVGQSNIMLRMGGGIDCNALTLRLGFEITVYSDKHLIMAKKIADAIKNEIEPQREISEEANKCYMEEGDGYADDYGCCDIFESDQKKLKEMIGRKSKEARLKFEKYDLDGNIEERWKDK